MAKSKQNPPLLACRSSAQTIFPDTHHQRLSNRRREALHQALAGIALKVSIGLVTKPYVSCVGYIASREARNSFSCRDFSSCALFVPIRDDSEMVVNLGLSIAEAGLRRLGVAA